MTLFKPLAKVRLFRPANLKHYVAPADHLWSTLPTSHGSFTSAEPHPRTVIYSLPDLPPNSYTAFTPLRIFFDVTPRPRHKPIINNPEPLGQVISTVWMQVVLAKSFLNGVNVSIYHSTSFYLVSFLCFSHLVEATFWEKGPTNPAQAHLSGMDWACV